MRNWLPPHALGFAGRGQVFLDTEVGDLVLFRRGSRFTPRDLRIPAEFRWPTHAAIAVSDGPNAVIVGRGAVGHVANLLDELVGVVRFEVSDDQKLAVADFARWSAGQRGEMTAARALERAGLIYDRSPYRVTPARLAFYLEVSEPIPLPRART